MTVGRKYHPFLEHIPYVVGVKNGDAPRQGKIALPIENPLTSEVKRHQGSRTGSLYVNARSCQVQFIGNLHGQIVFIVAEHQLKIGRRFKKVAVVWQNPMQVGTNARTGKDANGPRILLWNYPRAFEGFPSTFEKQALLGIHDLRLKGRYAEKFGIELLRIF